MNVELQQYVREALTRGIERERIRTTLLAARWPAVEVDSALASWADGEPGLPVPRRRISLSAREAFQHLVMFATLYLLTIDVGVVLFVLIDRRFRDALSVGRDTDISTLRWSISGAITALPIFLAMTQFIDRSLAAEPEKRHLGVRRWLTYLTMFVAALVLIGDFSTVISAFLSGGLTGNFVLKALVVFAIAGVVLGHYLGGLRRDEVDAETVRQRASVLGRLGVLASALAIVAGLWTAGTPQNARRSVLDARRVEDLMALAAAIDTHYRSNARLPASLDLIEWTNASSTQDPGTRQPYSYVVDDSLHYRIGTRFDSSDSLDAREQPIPKYWRHRSGVVMFTRSVGRSH